MAIAAGAFALLYAVRGESWARRTRLLAAAAVAASFGLTGHTLSQGGSVPLNLAVQFVHVLAAGTWLGTLAVMLWRGRHVDAGTFAGWVQRFSPMAVVSVSLLLLSGAVTTIVYLDPISRLWTTGYGWMLLGKVGLVLTIGAVGAYNWRVLTPRLLEPATASRLTRTARVEVVVGTVVLGLTAFLTTLPLE